MEKQEFIEVATKHFIIAAQWIETPDSWMREAQPTKAAKSVALRYVADFIDAAGPLIDQLQKIDGYGERAHLQGNAAAFGHDLWLASQGHGRGFWGREDLSVKTESGKALGVALTEIAKDKRFANIWAVLGRGWLDFSWVKP